MTVLTARSRAILAFEMERNDPVKASTSVRTNGHCRQYDRKKTPRTSSIAFKYHQASDHYTMDE